MREQRILVLDRERAVVARRAERIDELAPELDGMPGADRAEDPAPLGRPVAGDRLEHAVEREELVLEARVLRMHVEDRIAERVHAGERIHALPEQVRGIEVDADALARALAEPQHRRGVVDDEARVRLDRDANPVPLARTPRHRPSTGSTRSSHCHASVSGKSSGHEHVTQLGRSECSDSPGQPENVITVATPSSAASRTVSR